MKKKFLLFLIMIFTCVFSVKAASTQYFSVGDESALDDCFNKDNMCKLTNDITVASTKSIQNRVVLDLNGYTIEPSSNLKLTTGLFFVGRGGKLTIDDSKGTGKITTGNNIYAAIQMVSPTDSAGLEYDDEIKVVNSDAVAELIVNGGTLEGYYYGITGNGTRHNTQITVNGGTIKTINDDSVGIYQPQIGTTIINGGTIEGGTGIEIRSGNLKVNKGDIKGTSKFTAIANSSGTTTTGTGITVAQHSTKNPINVEINGGTISGENAFYEWNPQKNSKDALEQVKLSINGGNFKTTLSGGASVYSEDLTGFIHDGTFNTDVTKYKASDAKTVSKIVDTNKSNTGFGVFYGFLIIAALFVTYYLYKQYRKSN